MFKAVYNAETEKTKVTIEFNRGDTSVSKDILDFCIHNERSGGCAGVIETSDPELLRMLHMVSVAKMDADTIAIL